MASQSLRFDIISALPPETRVEIFKYLSLQELNICTQVNKTWKIIINSSEQTWINWCNRYGLVYMNTEDESPEKCKKFFVFMARRLTAMRSGQCCLTAPLHDGSVNRRSDINAFHSHGSIVVVATEDYLIRIYNVNLNPMLTLEFNILTDISDKLFIISQIRTDGTNVVVMDLRGLLLVMDANSGQLIARSDVAETAVCFDLLHGSLIVACGLQGSVKCFNVGRPRVIELKTSEDMTVLKVIVAQHWSESDSLLLFFLSIKNLYIFKINYIMCTSSSKATSIKLHDILFEHLELDGMPDHILNSSPSICYDGWKHFYFPHRFAMKRPSTICKLNVHTGEIEEINIGHPVDQILGAGKMNLALMTRGKRWRNVLLKVIDTRTFEPRVFYHLTSDLKEVNYTTTRPWGGDNSFICEKSWLNGFSKFNELGTICVFIHSRDTLNIIKWNQSEQIL